MLAQKIINSPGVFNSSAVIRVDATVGHDSGPSVGQRGQPGFPFASISAALAVAQDGDTILVNGGQYAENPTIPATFSLLVIQGVGLQAATLTGNISWTPNGTTGQLAILADLYLVGNITSDASAKVSGTGTIFRCRGLRHNGNITATGRGMGVDTFQAGGGSFVCATSTFTDVIAQLAPLAPHNSDPGACLATGVSSCELTMFDCNISNSLTVNGSASYDGHSNAVSGTVTAQNGGTVFHYGDELTGTDFCADGSSYIRAFEAVIIAGSAVFNGTGPIDQPTYFIDEETFSPSSQGFSIEPPFFDDNYQVLSMETSNTGGNPLLVSDISSSGFTLTDPVGGRTFVITVYHPPVFPPG
jgi:hypothetical protein